MDFKKEPLLKNNRGRAMRVSFLSPEQAEKPEEKKHRKNLLIFIFIAGLVLPIIAVGLLIAGGKMADLETNKTNQKIASAELALKNAQTDISEARLIVKSISAAKPLLENRFLWTKFFSFLEANTAPEITYDSLALDGKGVNLTGRALDYKTVARQIIAFKNTPAVRDLKVSGLSARISPKGEKDGVAFNFYLTLDNNLWKQ